MTTKEQEKQIENGSNEITEMIDRHKLSSASVPPEVTVSFYESIVEYLSDRISTLKDEHGV